MNFTLPKKQPPSRSRQKKNLAKLIVARSDIGACLSACKLFVGSVKKLGDELYYPLMTAIVVCYARPFTNNEPYGALPKKWSTFTNPRLQTVHSQLMKARHEMFAHSPLSIRRPMVIPAGVETAKIGDKWLKSTKIGTQTAYYLYPVSWVEQVWETATDLHKRLEAEIEQTLVDLYGGMDLPGATFAIRIDDEGL